MQYFEQVILPLIAERHREIASELSIQVLGSCGLGIADEFSDLDSVIWLDDPLWQAHGGSLQLALELLPQKCAPTDLHPGHYHPEVCVWPLSWLGKRRLFLEEDAERPWEEVTFEQFFGLQRNLVLRDPHGIFRRLREATAPDQFPERLWRKRLIQELKKLGEDLVELRQTVTRTRILEANIVLGRVLEDLLHLGFIINRRYYPWTTHLRWAFETLPEPAPAILKQLDVVASSPNWNERLAAAELVRGIYGSCIEERRILASEILDNLLWAERLEAWSRPDWAEDLARCRDAAKKAGVDPAHGWIWSLWGSSSGKLRAERNDP
jgi:hypothetical protein